MINNNNKVFRTTMSKYILLLLLLTGGQVTAQQPGAKFTWQAALPPVAQSGFYHIALTPAVAAKLNNDVTPNFRIYQGSKEVPYLLQEQVGGYDVSSFESFEVTDNIRSAGKNSTIVFHNTNGYTLDHFEMVFKNARVIKTMRISGSNDNKNWYGVTDTFVFDPASAVQDSSSTTLVKTIGIPSSNYAWYQLIIDDSTSAPVFIEKIGRYRTNSRAKEYTPVPAPTVSIVAVDKYPRETRVQLNFDQPYLINKLSFNITAPALYRRRAVMMVERELFDGKKTIIQPEDIASFELSSDQPAQVVLPSPGNYRRLLLVVQNDDNPPLQFGAVSAWQQTIWLTASLQQGQSYLVKGGDVNLPAPVYDLAYFKDSVPANIPLIQPEQPVNIAVAVTAEATPTVFKSKWWIWLGIIAIAVFLVFIAFKMLKEMQGKQ
ncbi:hypothetical protein [Chitinophaga sp. RAB17]|uniref:hypothetical protein n=1 Tax=Chitinophaga sp. RAB17 TaxID=3233049 RepID=UPI003F8FA175